MSRTSSVRHEIAKRLEESAQIKRAITKSKICEIERIVNFITMVYKRGGKVVLFANGGTAADASININPTRIEEAITDKTRAIMVVHTMGKPCDMDSILEIAKAHDLRIIEDAYEAHGASYKDRVVGSIGDMGTFSFYAAHAVVAGEGGMVVTNSDEIANVVRSVKSHGRPFGSIYFDFQRMGFDSRMNELPAAVGLVGLEQFDETFNKRRNNVYKLLELTEELSDYCYFLREEEFEKVSPHAFPLVLKDKKI